MDQGKHPVSATHTSGPWQVGSDEQRGAGDGSLVGLWIECADGARVGQAFGNCRITTDEAVRANARLFAAAPDLLAMVRQYASECAECDGEGEVLIEDDDFDREPWWQPCPDCQDIREVIAMATQP